LDEGVDLEAADYRRWTALHLAAHRGNINILSLLLSYGANLDAKNNRGDLPIDLADTEEIKQAIRDEEIRRDHRFKRIPAADLLPAPATAASDTKEVEGDGGEGDEEDDESSGDDDDDE
jgi:hypothetical protein